MVSGESPLPAEGPLSGPRGRPPSEPTILPEISDPDPREGDEHPPGTPSDHDLIRRARTGEEEAFATLVLRHEERAWRVARGLVANREDARDLAQEAFLRVFRSLDRFDYRHGFTTWLYRIVTNLAIDHLRRRRPALSTAAPGEEETDLDLHDDEAPLPSAAMEREETAALVRECIERLPPHFRSAMVLRELEGLSCKEIAGIVGATHVTVRWRLHRGRKLFQIEWERMVRTGLRGPLSTDPGPLAENDANTGETHPVQSAEDARRGCEPPGETEP